MTCLRSIAVGPFSVLVLLATMSCGSNRQLQTVALQPATADAKDFPNGQVPFLATGTFSKPPSPVPLTSKDVTWCYGGPANVANPTAGICAGNIAPAVTVDANGLAQCAANAQGTFFVLAGKTSTNLMGNPDAGPQFTIFGSAQLTCP